MTDYYVNPDGSDEGGGLDPLDPWATLGKSATVINASGNHGDTVHLCGEGTLGDASAVTFTKAVSIRPYAASDVTVPVPVAINTGGNATPILVKGFEIDCDGADIDAAGAALKITDAIGTVQDVIAGNGNGGTTANAAGFVQTAENRLNVDCYNCDFHHSAGDTVSHDATGAGSQLRLHNPTLHDCGAAANNQVLTGHTGSSTWVYGGTISGSQATNTNAIAADAYTTPIYLYDVTVTTGSVLCNHAERCTLRAGALSIRGLATGNTITTDDLAEIAGLILVAGGAEAPNAVGNWIDCAAITAGNKGGISVAASTTLVAFNTILNATASDYDRAIYVGANATVEIRNNTILAAAQGISIGAAGATVTLTNNAIVGRKYSVIKSAGAVTGTNNVLSGTLSGYTLGAGDVAAVPQLDALNVPIRGGNCDNGRGSTAVGGAGELDGLGRPCLRADARHVGAICPQWDHPNNVVLPIWRFPHEARGIAA